MALTLCCLFCAVSVFSVLTVLLDTSKTDKVRDRLSDLVTNSDIDALYESIIEDNKRKKRKDKKPVIKISRQLEDLLAMSGVKLNANEYLYGWIGMTFIPAAILLMCGANILTVAAGAIIGLAIPPLLVRRSRNKRLQQFSRQLGESLTVMSNCLRSGFSFIQAMESIATEMQPPISVEFARVLREMKFGVSMETALEHMKNRIKSEELELFVSAVLTSSQLGSNLVDILDICTATVQDRLKIKDDIRVMSSQGRMSGLVLSLLPIIITLILMLINPEYIMAFFESDIGQILVIVGIIMEIIGFLVMRKMVSIKY